jgi:DNA-binding beta-propeller fold protein YncE
MFRSAFIISSVLLLFSSCKKDVGAVNYGDFPADVGRIMGNTCATSGCHDAKSYMGAAELDLSTWKNMFKGSNSGSPVIPFNSKFSSLCYFINTYSDLGAQNVPTMPLNKSPLSHDQVKLIKDWIDVGAPDVNGNIRWGDDPNRRKLYATNQGCDMVTVFDSQTQLPIRFIEVGNQPGPIEVPHQVKVSPDGKFWYVNFINADILQKYSCADDKLIAEIPMVAGGGALGSWNTMAITKDGKKAFCVSLNGRITCVDLVNNRIAKSVGMGDSPHAVALSADESKLYVGASGGNYIQAWDTTLTAYTQLSLDGNAPGTSTMIAPHDMYLDSASNNLVVTCQNSDDLRVFSIAANTVIATIHVGTFPQEIVYYKTTSNFFVTCMNDVTGAGTMGSVYKIENGSWATTSVPCGYLPHGICVDDKKKTIYVASRNIVASGPAQHHTSICAGRNGFVNYIDINSFTVQKKKFELSVDPYYISLRP